MVITLSSGIKTDQGSTPGYATLLYKTTDKWLILLEP